MHVHAGGANGARSRRSSPAPARTAGWARRSRSGMRLSELPSPRPAQAVAWRRSAVAGCGPPYALCACACTGRDGLSPAVALLGGVAARTFTKQTSSPRRGKEICSVEVLAATRSCCTIPHGRWVRCWLPQRPRRARGRPGLAGAPRALARQDRAAGTKSISSRSSPDSGDDRLLIDFVPAARS